MPVLYRVKRFFKKICRSWDYAKFGWSNYDYDFGFLFSMLRFKLERMEKFLCSKDALCCHEPPTRQSLRLAVRLAKRLEKDAYSHVNYLTDETNKRDLRWFFSIIEKYHGHWWD